MSELDLSKLTREEQGKLSGILYESRERFDECTKGEIRGYRHIKAGGFRNISKWIRILQTDLGEELMMMLQRGDKNQEEVLDETVD